ncbi:TlpA family protein disulfide reductase [Aliikangiella maris]|uniref:TlpA disulfide reductase family protein n=2 Tax=Aliikangiella maris TaxID=3162458 RepID=A0ABV2BP48_9GAMM
MKTIAYFIRTILFGFGLILTGCTQNGQFTLLDGKSYSLDDFSGQWVIINFWAEWCSPCLEEIPELNKLANQEQAFKVTVIGVSYDQLTLNQLTDTVKKWQIEYPVIATEPVPILPFELPPTLPTNYLLNPDGKIVAKLVGTQTYESLNAAILKAQNK